MQKKTPPRIAYHRKENQVSKMTECGTSPNLLSIFLPLSMHMTERAERTPTVFMSESFLILRSCIRIIRLRQALPHFCNADPLPRQNRVLQSIHLFPT